MTIEEYAKELMEVLNLKVSAGLTSASLPFIEDCVKAVLRDERQDFLKIVQEKKAGLHDRTSSWERGYFQACVEIVVYIYERISNDA